MQNSPSDATLVKSHADLFVFTSPVTPNLKLKEDCCFIYLECSCVSLASLSSTRRKIPGTDSHSSADKPKDLAEGCSVPEAGLTLTRASVQHRKHGTRALPCTYMIVKVVMLCCFGKDSTGIKDSPKAPLSANAVPTRCDSQGSMLR